MRMSIQQVTKSSNKDKTMKRVPLKKKKADSKTMDSISETISFVIKGKLTSLKPTVLTKKQIKTKSIAVTSKRTKLPRKSSQSSKDEHTEPLKKTVVTKPKKGRQSKKKSPAKALQTKQSTDNVSNATVKTTKANHLGEKKDVKKIRTPKKTTTKINKTRSQKSSLKVLTLSESSEIAKTPLSDSIDNEHDNDSKGKDPENVVEKRSKHQDDKAVADKPQKSIESKKLKAGSNKSTNVSKTPNKTKLKRLSSINKESHLKKVPLKKQIKKKIKSECPSSEESSNNSDEADLVPFFQQSSERSDLNKEDAEILREEAVKLKKSTKATEKRQPSVKITPTKSKAKTQKHLKGNNQKMLIMKKRILAKENEEKKLHKMKLFGFWNGPKRHRVASLNALAKVHCLYENETRSALLDDVKKEVYVKKEIPEEPEDSPPPVRNLRAAPRLGAIGKHWDMNEMSSSSSEENETIIERPKPKALIKRIKQEENVEKVEKPKPEKKRRRNRTEIIMDLKDMVVRKRMASLNATAILAASYSTEKRSCRSPKSEADSTDSDESFIARNETKNVEEEEEDIVKKEEEKKVIELRTTPNKKVSVILNQDTDVTITGVYVNSTTRSTHHEGYCSIAGMQYRISATSHTQTAATAMATENLLQSAGGPDSAAEDNVSPTCKSYTPLGALSNMKPPGAPDGQHGMTLGHSPHLGPPHMVPVGPPQHGAPHLSPVNRRHAGCTSAFSAPPSGHFGTPPGHPGHPVPEQGYAHGYYQPAGPLITAPPPHAGHPQQPPPQQQQPVPPPPTLAPPTKAAPLSSEPSTSPTPPPPSSQQQPPTHRPPPPSSATESSDSDVIITSPPVVKETIPSQQPPPAYRYSQYSSPHHAYSYNYPPQYYPNPPPAPAYGHHDLCYSTSPYLHKAYPTTYRRYLPPPSGTQFFQATPPDLYNPPQPTANPPGQQMVAANPAANGTSYQTASGPPPPSALIESYAPPPALLDPYPPPPPHYYPGYGPAPPPTCYTHSAPSRTIPYLNAAYSTCPCPMQSCPKNVHAGPLTGDSKRSVHISAIAKDSVPLPPVALALPLEPVSATGPPSPARGSAGMPPPPSPAGATYQPPPPAPKQEASENPECKPIEKIRKARIGKNMVRNNIAANFPENTMLLMCHAPQHNTNITKVKREIESPEEKKEEKVEPTEPLKPPTTATESVTCPTESEQTTTVVEPEDLSMAKHKELELKEEEKSDKESEDQKPTETPKVEEKEEELLPCVKTVAENVKMKNMKRKLSMTKESEKTEVPILSPKKLKVEKPRANGSYKDLIKKDVPCVKINNGKRKLITDNEKNTLPKTPTKTSKRKAGVKRKPSPSKEEPATKRAKLSKPLANSNQLILKSTKEKGKSLTDSSSELSENKEPGSKILRKISTNSKCTSTTKKMAPAVLDSLFAKNSVDRTIESVVSNCWDAGSRTNKKAEVNSKSSKFKYVKVEPVSVSNKSTNAKSEQCKQKVQKVNSRKKSKSKEEPPIPQTIVRPRKSVLLPRWSNGWTWDGEPFQAKVFLNSDEATVVRKCYPAMVHAEGDRIETRDCVLLKAGQRKNELPFVAKIAALWENPEDGEMMISLLWYYRPEHTEQGRQPTDEPDEVFASRHKDTNSVACIEDKCYVLTFNEYCRYRKNLRRLEEGIEETKSFIPSPEVYPRIHRQPSNPRTPSDLVFFCRRVYDFRQKRIVKNPS